jgi:hypothetical protein
MLHMLLGKGSAQKVEIGGVVAHFEAVLRERPRTICLPRYRLLDIRLLVRDGVGGMLGASMGVSTNTGSRLDANAGGDLLLRVLSRTRPQLSIPVVGLFDVHQAPDLHARRSDFELRGRSRAC